MAVGKHLRIFVASMMVEVGEAPYLALVLVRVVVIPK